MRTASWNYYLKRAGGRKPFVAVLMLIALLTVVVATIGRAQAQPRLFAAVFRTGPNWDASKSPNDQALFREHSANLARLRAAGTIVIGARYADVGLMVVSASSDSEARRLFDPDPSIPHGTFLLEIHPFSVVYGGALSR